jgi:hypothetical protein
MSTMNANATTTITITITIIITTIIITTLTPTLLVAQDNYANSSEAMCITRLSGEILDCNGAALHLFAARDRRELCGAGRMVVERMCEVSMRRRRRRRMRMMRMMMMMDDDG